MPPQGGDHPTRQAPIGTGQFQSTPPHGRQPSLIRSWAAAAWAFQSTPPHGRRRKGGYGSSLMSLFQSTPPHGRRQRRPAEDLTSSRFQSTPPHGRRHRLFALIALLIKFQSTPPHGRRRPPTVPGWYWLYVSIHASAREATSAVMGVRFSPGMFQSTPPHGRRRSITKRVEGMRRVSIHASAREATWVLWRVSCHSVGFNPRLRTGGDARQVAGHR